MAHFLTVPLSRGMIAQLLYCCEQMETDYRDGSPDAEEFRDAVAVLAAALNQAEGEQCN